MKGRAAWLCILLQDNDLSHITMAHVSSCCILWDWLSGEEETDGVGREGMGIHF